MKITLLIIFHITIIISIILVKSNVTKERRIYEHVYGHSYMIIHVFEYLYMLIYTYIHA